MNTKLTLAVRRAVEAAPCSVNALATVAGVQQATLSRIMSGDRQATAALAEKLKAALEGWGRDCRVGARGIGKALYHRSTEGRP